MNVRKLIFLSLFSATVLYTNAQNKTYEQIIEIAQQDNQVMKHLDVLTNRFGGRPIGSDAYDNAGDWALSKFAEWGIKAQKEEAGQLPVGFNRGPWFGTLLAENGMNLHFVTPSYTSGTKGLQRGHVVIEPKTQSQFDQMKGRLNGAWVLVTGNSTGWPVDFSEKGDSLRAILIAENEEIEKKNQAIRKENRENGTDNPLLPYKDAPALFYKEMRDAGILGIIQSAKVPLTALYDRNVAFDPTMNFDKLPSTPDIKLDEEQYAKIYKMAKERRSFELEFDIRNHFKMGPVKYHNIVAVIPGAKKPDEYVLLSGHLDAFDVATGGVDDGSGVTPVMEAARLLAAAKAKPDRTIVFCLFAGEEFGLLGAKAYTETHEEQLGKISNLFNRDGGPTVPVGIDVPQNRVQDFEKIAEQIRKLNPDFPFKVGTLTPRPQPKGMGGTDASVFAMKGVPTMHLITADSKGYDFSYGEIWHTERDLYNKSIPEYQEQAAAVMAIMALGVANLDSQITGNEVYTQE